MKKVVLIFVLIFLTLTACNTTDSNMIALEEVLSAFEKHKLPLKEVKVSNDDIFGMKLNGIRPFSYELGGKLLLIFIYDSTKKREEGLNDFRNKTATLNIVSYNYYEAKNALLFYVHGLDLSKEVEFDNKIHKIVGELDKE
ncbi:hypothetical protein [Lederbergia panacisoli]|uniref:hypothetical protein n=1 Tax=Lederbergia panacisoli TaxID=1255251 RepID=UPI00214CB668|nr:hypothetical protein [Lederbergia panacisoli]MCR2822221.1 hypothetical protein [Lederbergia panacisoli]